jgi:hypothetical protein
LVSDLTVIAIPALYELEKLVKSSFLVECSLTRGEESGNQPCKENKKVDHYEYDNNLRCIEAELAGLRRDFESLSLFASGEYGTGSPQGWPSK